MQHLSSSSTRQPYEEKNYLDGLIVRVADFSEIDIIRELNTSIFNEERVINTFDRSDLLMLIAYLRGIPVGFKIGYKHTESTFYSAKGGVLDMFRRQGIARSLLYEMIERVRLMGYQRFIFDTFPNRHPGMAIMGLEEGFHLVKADFNSVYKDIRLQFAKDI